VNFGFVELTDSSGELFALHPVKEKLSNLFAAALILGSGGRLIFFLLFVLVVDWTETVLRVPCLVLCFCVFGLDLPNALFLKGKRSPAIPCGDDE